jgi:hypothetical protein
MKGEARERVGYGITTGKDAEIIGKLVSPNLQGG